jgi:hypothetical protein
VAGPTDPTPGRTRSFPSYSPQRRTALLFSGTGAHGAYHAGVLRALQDAGIKIDLVAGHGIGAASAALAAIDGSARLWEQNGLWSSPATRSFYDWKPLLRIVLWFAAALGVLLVVPLLVLALGLIAYPIGFLITLIGLSAGPALTAAYSGWLQSVFAPEHLPTVLPRFVMLVLVLMTVAAAAGLVSARWRTPPRRRSTGGWWWDILGTPLDAVPARQALVDAIWQLIRGAAGPGRVEPRVVGRRYADVLSESLGQPGFRELITVATDLDSRRDIVVSFLREPYRSSFLTPRDGRDRRAEVLDLAGFGREHGLEVVTAALTPPVGFDPALVTFGPDSYWRGETHRLCDRPEAIGRLIDELDLAGVRQLILVSGVAPASGPHQLSSPRLDTRHRLGDYLVAAETIALEQAVTLAHARFEAVYVVAPGHNPLGPFDFGGVYDEASDRRQEVGELLDLGYSDVHRQFIEPVVGASGEHLARNISSQVTVQNSQFTR